MIQELKRQIEILQSKIKIIQEQCSHPEMAVIKKNGANTGNYDPSCDSYYTDHECTLCDKRWRTDQ